MYICQISLAERSLIPREGLNQLMLADQDFERVAGEGLDEKERPNVSILYW